MPSEKQVSFYKSLLTQTTEMTQQLVALHDEDPYVLQETMKVLVQKDEERIAAFQRYSVSMASDLIGKALAAKNAMQASLNAKKAATASTANLAAVKASGTKYDKVGEGMYKFEGDIYKVQEAKYGSGRCYAKKLTQCGDKWRFEYAQGAIAQLKNEHKLTIEEAKTFGKLYGVCCACGRILTDETSIEMGIGPICAEKF